MIKGWLERCDASHSCPPQQDHILPCRVIDVGSDTKDPKLVITSGRTGRWVALSHCWGLKLPIRTDSHNINQHCKTIPLSTLTANFRDAILITRGLGLTFLWIDALCIIQDSIQDWYNESLKMSYVYENAVLTIAAEASEGSKTGIFASTQVSKAVRGKFSVLFCLVMTRAVVWESSFIFTNITSQYFQDSLIYTLK